MAHRKYKLIDVLTCEVSETSTVKKNVNVDGILAKKQQLEEQLAMADEVIAEMKKVGNVFTKVDKQLKE